MNTRRICIALNYRYDLQAGGLAAVELSDEQEWEGNITLGQEGRELPQVHSTTPIQLRDLGGQYSVQLDNCI